MSALRWSGGVLSPWGGGWSRHLFCWDAGLVKGGSHHPQQCRGTCVPALAWHLACGIPYDAVHTQPASRTWSSSSSQRGTPGAARRAVPDAPGGPVTRQGVERPPAEAGCGLSDRRHRRLFQCQMGSAGCFCKKPDSNYFGFCGPYHLCSNHSTLLLTQDSSPGQEVSGHGLFQ